MFNLKKTIEYLFYLIIFLLPWQGVWIWREVFAGGDKWEYGTIGVYGVDVLIILFLILNLLEQFKNGNLKFKIFNFYSIFKNLNFKLNHFKFISNFKFQITNYNYVLRLTSYALVIWAFISIAWSPDKILALYFSFKIFLAVGMFWTVMKIKLDWRKLIAVLLLAGALQGGLATGQFLMQQDFGSSILGTSQHLPGQGGSSVIETESGRWLRAYGTFAHPNILGGYLAVVLLIAVNYELRIRNYGKENQKSKIKYQNENLKLKNNFLTLSNWKLFGNLKFKIRNYNYVLCLTCLAGRQASYVLLLSGLIVSFSRSAWIVFASGFILLLIFQKEKRRELAKMTVIFLGVGLIWLSAFLPLFFSRTTGQGRLEQKSFGDRSEYVMQAKEIIRNNFWLGVGAGNYTKAVAEKNTQKPIWQIQPVHNIFLLIWSELGFAGMFLFSLFLLLVAVGIFLTHKYFSAFVAPGLLFFASDHWIWTSHFGIIFFFLIIGLIARNRNSVLTKENLALRSGRM